MAGIILLVEDNTIARRNIAVFLERAGYQVTQAGTGEDALRLVEGTYGIAVISSRAARKGAKPVICGSLAPLPAAIESPIET